MKKSLVLLTIAVAFVACKKDKGSDAQVLHITPEIVTGYIGKDWSAVEPTMKNKKDYWYTELNNQQVEAAVSLPAIDPAAPGQHYKLTINLTNGHKISIIDLESTDTLDQVTGNNNFLYFYQHSAALMTGITSQRQWVMEVNNPQTMVTPDSLVNALKAGKATQPSLSWQNNAYELSLVYFSSTGGFRMTL